MKLKFKNEDFKILQIADTQEGSRVSPDTLALINTAIEKEKPDLIVYSGDQIWGKSSFNGNPKKVEEILRKLCEPAFSRNIPFAVCFGNHDRQVGLSNEEQFEIYKKFPFSIHLLQRISCQLYKRKYSLSLADCSLL